MELLYKVLSDDIEISFCEAIKNKKILITNNGLQSQENVKILRNTELFDGNGKPIYENDVLVDKNNNKYQVSYKKGNFIIELINGNTGCTPFLLSALKLNTVIDTLFII